MQKRLHKALKWLLGSVVLVVVLLGIVVAAFGYVVGRVPQYRVELQHWISARSGLAVEFRTLSARLRRYGPELVFDDAIVRTPDRARVLASARRGSVGFDLWSSIANGRLTAGRFALEGPQLGLIRTREGRIQLLGQSALPERDDKPFALEQLPTGRFEVEHAVVSFRDEITGRGPWSLSGVSFELKRDSASMELRGSASLPRALGSELEFSATAQGPLEDAAALVTTFNVEGEHLDLAGWADVLPDDWPAPETGRGSLQLRGTLKGRAWQQLAADVDFTAVAAAPPAWSVPLPTAAPLLPPRGEAAAAAGAATVEPQSEATTAFDAAAAPDMVSYSRIALSLRAQKVGNEWKMHISDLELARPASSWRAARIEAHWSRGAEGQLSLGGKADRVVLDSLWPLLAYLPESDALARVRALAATGTLQDLTFGYERSDAALSYSAEAQLSNLGFRPIERIPGVSGLGGSVHLTERGGRWRVAAKNLRFELPRMFREPLAAASVDGTVEWRREADGLTIDAKSLRVAGADGEAVAAFGLKVPRDGSSPVLDLTARGEDLKVSATGKYVPADRLGPRTLQWFDRALRDGRVTGAELVFKGPTRAFPFRKDEGLFRAQGHVEQALLDYQPGWAPAENVTADLEFHNEGMHIRASSASIAGLAVENATADIADFKQSKLVIEAAARGDLEQGLQLLKDSPLAASLGPRFEGLSGRGPLAAQVRLYLPIKDLKQRQVDVTARLRDAAVAMRNVNAPVRSLNGNFTIRNTLLTAADLRAQWLGGAVAIDARPQGEAASVLSARGHAGAAQLSTLFGLPPAIKLSGATDWQLTTTLTNEASDAAGSVRLDSDLRGLAIGLPAPLGKGMDEAVPLQLTVQPEGETAILARGSLGNVRSLLRLRRVDDSWTLDRGGLRADGIVPALPNHQGLRIEGMLERFALAEWLALRGPSRAGGRPLSEILHAANVRIGSFELSGYRWPDVRGILQATPAGWRIDVSGPNAVGQVLIPESFSGAQPLRATLERLVLEKAAPPVASDGRSRDPRELPNLEVYVADLRLGPRTIGAVDLKATRVPQGIRFDSVNILGAAVRAEGQGEWLQTADGPYSSLKATITSSDLAATLRALNYQPFIEAKQGELRGDLRWPGGFDGNILAHASGAITLHAEAGQLLAVQPGAGRMLGLFSVAALPRRLALDFSDLTEKGLAFDTVHGDFELRDGNAFTSNLLLRGPAAEIGIAGRTGLAARDYDQTAVVTGNLGASLPVAGALAGGPAIGAALLLFSQVFKEPLKGITRGYYRITGPWDEPAIERVEASSVKVSEQK